MTILAGIDFSTRQIDAALIALDPDGDETVGAVFRAAQLPASTDPAARARAAREAIRDLLADVPLLYGLTAEVTMVWVEEPWGFHRNADRALLPLYGAIMASVPTRASVAGIQPQEWRRTLGLPARLDKDVAVDVAKNRLARMGDPRTHLTEHQADAVLVAHAGRHLCWQATAA